MILPFSPRISSGALIEIISLHFFLRSLSLVTRVAASGGGKKKVGHLPPLQTLLETSVLNNQNIRGPGSGRLGPRELVANHVHSRRGSVGRSFYDDIPRQPNHHRAEEQEN